MMIENNNFLTKNISYSQLRTFITNPWEWQNNRLLGIYDNTIWVNPAIGTVLHTFVEYYLKQWVIEEAINIAYSTIYDSPDSKTYIIPAEEAIFLAEEIKANEGKAKKIENIKKSFDESIKNKFWTKVVDFGKSWSNKELLKWVEGWINAFTSEHIDFGELLWVEFEMEYDVKDKLWSDLLVTSPLPFKAIADIVCRTTSQKAIMVDWEVQQIEPNSIFIEDMKFKVKHSDMLDEDPKYIFQAFFNYYCVKAHYWEAPKFIIFREIKTSKNRDWSSQHQTVTIPFFGKVFEEYKIYFWRYLLENFERIKLIQERDFLFNIFDMTYWIKEWEKQKAYYLNVEVGQLKSRIAQVSKNKIAQNVPVMWDRDPLIKNSQKIWKGFSDDDLFSTENKIMTAFRNFWVLMKYEKKIEWYSFDQYLFTPARWITMSKIKLHLPEIIQALEVEKWLRIEAPVLGTKFIWVEIPRETRRFALYKKVKEKWPVINIGISINGETEKIDLSDADTPHLIVAWQTWSWKSVFLESVIQSLKDKWNIHIVDPKRVWLMAFKYLASSYDTDAESILIRLDFLKQRMYKIYDELETRGFKDIYEANKHLKKSEKFTPHFVIIDELASLVHGAHWASLMWIIGQLVNLWRAAGVHMIIATQRPSIKVIPWDIKANISTRVCFALATEVDSKVVLDTVWAEELLGKWDMLFMNRGIKRLQWFYIDNNNDRKKK